MLIAKANKHLQAGIRSSASNCPVPCAAGIYCTTDRLHAQVAMGRQFRAAVSEEKGALKTEAPWSLSSAHLGLFTGEVTDRGR